MDNASHGPRAVPWHLFPDGAGVDSRGELLIHGLSVTELAQEMATPLFVYDEQQIRSRFQEAKKNFSGQIAYAAKAFFCKAMAEIVADEDIHLDAASMGEIYVALSGGVDPSKIVFHGNNKSLTELRFAVEHKVGLIVVDSFDEIERLEKLATFPLRVGVRITPGIEAHTHEFIRTGQDDSKFGFNVQNGDAATAISMLSRSPKFDMIAVHAHIGSQIFSLSSFRQEVEVLSTFLAGVEVEDVILGGGLGVAYLRDERAPSIKEWVQVIDDAGRRSGLSKGRSLVIEPGRSIVATAGLTLYEVGTIKRIPGVRDYISVDGGMSDNPRPVLYGSGYEALAAKRLFDSHDTRFSVAGKHCESGDVVVRDAKLPSDISVGELIVTPVTGAYGFSMSSNYNKVTRPAVIFVDQSGYRVVVRRETLEDLVRNDI
jgi:diaminopimelate decarboxylase